MRTKGIFDIPQFNTFTAGLKLNSTTLTRGQLHHEFVTDALAYFCKRPPLVQIPSTPA
ncbi:hypothetical protein [Paenibacillus chitinolyticus]